MALFFFIGFYSSGVLNSVLKLKLYIKFAIIEPETTNAE